MQHEAGQVERAQEGDQGAYGVLVEAHYRVVYGIAYAAVRDSHDAFDLAQETFLVAWQQLKMLRKPDAFPAWLHQITRNLARNWVRSATYRQRIQDHYAERSVAMAEKNPMSDAALARDEAHETLRKALDALSPTLRETVVLFYFQECSVEETARALGITNNAVKKRTQHAREKLRMHFEQRWERALSAEANRVSAKKNAARVMGLLAMSPAVGIAGKAAATEALVTIQPWTWQGALLKGSVAMKMKSGVVALAVGVALLVGGVAYKVSQQEVSSTTKDQAVAVVSEQERNLGSQDGDGAAVEASGAMVESEGVASAGRSETAGPDAVVADAEGMAVADPSSSVGGEITGRVYDAETGEGIEGAVLQVLARGQGAPGGAQEIVTDTDGNYRIGGLGEATYRIIRRLTPVYRDGDYDDSQYVAMTSVKKVTGIDFPVHMGVTISGLVLDVDGQSVEGASVRGRGLVGIREQDSQVSDSEGRFALLGFSVGTEVEVEATTEDFVSAPLKPMTLPEQGISDLELRLSIPSTAMLAGVVVNQQDRPVSGVRVSLGFKRGNSFLIGLHMTETDNDGSFEISKLRPGVYNLYVQQAGRTEFNSSVLSNIELDQGQEIRDLRPLFDREGGMTIAGRVTNLQNEGVGGVTLFVWGVENYRTQSDGLTDARGYYEVAGLTEGTYNIRARGGNYSLQTLNDVVAGSSGVDIVLEGRGSLEGFITDASTGNPIEHFRMAHRSGDNAGAERRSALRRELQSYTDSTGHYALPQVEVGESTLLVEAEGYVATVELVYDLRAGEATRLDFALERGLRLTGRVVDDAGAPIVGASIVEDTIFDRNLHEESILARSGPDGEFVVTSIAPTSTTLAAHHPDYAFGVGVIQNGHVTIALGSGGVLEGHVTVGGTPFAGATVRSRSIGKFATTDAQGFYQLTKVGEGQVKIEAYFQPSPQSWRRSLNQEAIIEAGMTTTVNFDFAEANAVLTGRVMSEGAPVTSGVVWLAVGDERFKVLVDGRGHYEFQGLPGGTAQVQLNIAGSRIREIELLPNMTQELDFNLTDDVDAY